MFQRAAHRAGLAWLQFFPGQESCLGIQKGILCRNVFLISQQIGLPGKTVVFLGLPGSCFLPGLAFQAKFCMGESLKGVSGLPVFLFPKGQTGLGIGEGGGLFSPDLFLVFPIRQGFLGIFYRLSGIFQGLLGILLSCLSGLDGIQGFQGSGYPLGNGGIVRKTIIQGSLCFLGLDGGLTGLFCQPRQQDLLGLEQHQRICGGLLGVLIPLILGLNFVGFLNGSRQLGIPGHGFFFPGALFQLGLGFFQL